MKKIYESPAVRITMMETVCLAVASIQGNGDMKIGNGSDEEARSRSYDWDEDY